MTLVEKHPEILILTGPTASGKTALALELAERLRAEVVALDSMTLYRGMDTGTAKPTPGERARVPHHLIDVLDPWESGHVAWWLAEADRVVADILARGRRPLFVGGTPFFLKALLHGLFDAPPADEAVRRRFEQIAEAEGNAALHRLLAGVDPASAARLHANDVRRVVRALEVHELTGRPLSEHQAQSWDDPEATARALTADVPRCLCLDVPRAELLRRIDLRAQAMIDEGWLDEVRRLRGLPHPLSREASRALGYAEWGEHLDGLRGFAETLELVRVRSRQYAKRQETWFRSLPGLVRSERKLTFHHWHVRMI